MANAQEQLPLEQEPEAQSSKPVLGPGNATQSWLRLCFTKDTDAKTGPSTARKKRKKEIGQAGHSAVTLLAEISLRFASWQAATSHALWGACAAFFDARVAFVGHGGSSTQRFTSGVSL